MIKQNQYSKLKGKNDSTHSFGDNCFRAMIACSICTAFLPLCIVASVYSLKNIHELTKLEKGSFFHFVENKPNIPKNFHKGSIQIFLDIWKWEFSTLFHFIPL